MISYTKVLTTSDWENLHGNDIYITMLRNKVKVLIEKDQKVLTINGYQDESLLDVVLDYLKEVPEDLVYYDIEDVYGHKTVYVYFASAIDKENFYHYYRTVYCLDGLDKT
jgi:hypothetical protein|tara:strand:+ start:557 stop:886 length:330 start_codon:yes stop_codon:yes gene_type:complete